MFRRGVQTGHWWQTQFGDWRRTSGGSTLDAVFDRFAENYVEGIYRDAEALERALDRYLFRLRLDFGDIPR